MKKLLLISFLSMLSIKSVRLNAQSFEINRMYGAIPCTVKYEILDTFLNVLYTETVSNPPGPISPTPCQYPGPSKPKYIRFIVIGSGNVTVPLDGTPGILFLNCLPVPGNFAFYGNIQTLPPPSCNFRIDIQI
jgi:hypothetical protein